MYNPVISITLANKATKVSQIMGLFFAKLEQIILFRMFFLKSPNNT